MASKYAHIIDKLPRHLGTEPAHQEKINAVKDAMIRDPDFERSATALAHRYAILRAMRETMPIDEVLKLDPSLSSKSLKEAASVLQVQIDAVEQMLTEQYEVEGTHSLSLRDGGTIRTQYEPYASVVDKEMFRLWCIKNGYERELHMPWMKTNSLVKEILLNGDPEPEGVQAKAIVKVFLTRGR